MSITCLSVKRGKGTIPVSIIRGEKKGKGGTQSLFGVCQLLKKGNHQGPLIDNKGKVGNPIIWDDQKGKEKGGTSPGDLI